MLPRVSTTVFAPRLCFPIEVVSYATTWLQVCGFTPTPPPWPDSLRAKLVFFMLLIALSKHVKIVTLTNPIYIYKDNPLWVLNSNSLRMQI
jgi:hypothetical protein